MTYAENDVPICQSCDPLRHVGQIARDPQTGESKGYGFISYNDFDASDAALEALNNQYLMNKPITVQYAFKKDGKGERHGTAAERLLAAQAKSVPVLSPIRVRISGKGGRKLMKVWN